MFRKSTSVRTVLFLAVLAMTLPAASRAFTVPTNDGFVTDIAEVIDADQERQLEQYLREFKQETNIIVALVTVSSLGSSVDIDASANDILRKWRVGTSTADEEGIVMLYGYGDRKLGVAMTPRLMEALPDETVERVIEADVLPQIRDGLYAQAFVSAIDSFHKHLTGDYTDERYEEVEGSGPARAVVLFVISLAFISVASFYGKQSPWWFGAFAGCVMGFVFIAFHRWWLGVPLLTALGAMFDFVLTEHKAHGRRGGRKHRRRPRSL